MFYRVTLLYLTKDLYWTCVTRTGGGGGGAKNIELIMEKQWEMGAGGGWGKFGEGEGFCDYDCSTVCGVYSQHL
jgi:hypothetical protein